MPPIDPQAHIRKAHAVEQADAHVRVDAGNEFVADPRSDPCVLDRARDDRDVRLQQRIARFLRAPKIQLVAYDEIQRCRGADLADDDMPEEELENECERQHPAGREKGAPDVVAKAEADEEFFDQGQTGASIEHYRDNEQAIEYRAKIIGLDRRDGGNGIGDQQRSEQDDCVAQRGATRAPTSVSRTQACEDRMG